MSLVARVELSSSLPPPPFFPRFLNRFILDDGVVAGDCMLVALGVALVDLLVTDPPPQLLLRVLMLTVLPALEFDASHVETEASSVARAKVTPLPLLPLLFPLLPPLPPLPLPCPAPTELKAVPPPPPPSPPAELELEVGRRGFQFILRLRSFLGGDTTCTCR